MSDSLRRALQTAVGSNFTLGRELGGGGMSRVFVGRDEALGRDVVVKVLAPEMIEGLSVERFTREIRLAAGLQDPHIVPVLTAGSTADGLPFYTMPFVGGENLRTRMQVGAISNEEALSVLRDVAKALTYAHSRHVVHRDIKPENILLSNGTAVVTDFGIAKAIEISRTLADGSASVGLTRTGASIGTPAYMAPEQAAGDPATDQRADIYAWGVVAYELLSGKHPFASRPTPQLLMAAHFSEMPSALVTSAGGVSSAVVSLVMRCLAKDPADRPTSAAELVSALSSTSTVVIPRHARKKSAAIGVSVVALIALVTTLWMKRGGDGVASGNAAATPIMLAVLPFENIGADEQAIFTDGLTDAVTSKLSALSSLGVIDRRSAMQYRQTSKPSRQIGDELGVQYLLQGVVRWAKDAAGKLRAQVTPSLIDAKSGVIKWTGASSLITPDDPFTAQGIIAGDVAKAMEVALDPADRTRLARRFTENPQAFAAYQRGRAELNE
ncbi:MAG: serine/threonine-protein kinase, partial [Gemmatimonadaceae bacterium]